MPDPRPPVRPDDDQVRLFLRCKPVDLNKRPSDQHLAPQRHSRHFETREPFLRPLVSSALGGNASYVPIPYERSLAIVLRAEKLQFYQVNYARYPPGTSLSSWSDSAADLEAARKLWSSAGTDVHSFVTPPGTETKRLTATKTVEPGGRATLFDVEEPGRIVGLTLRPASALAGKDRALVLRVFWDDDDLAAIEVPAGDFFGASFGEPAARSLLVGTAGETAYIYFPMPFDRRARVEIGSDDASASALTVEAELFFTKAPRIEGEGKPG